MINCYIETSLLIGNILKNEGIILEFFG